MFGMAGTGACRRQSELATFDHCDRNPTDSVPPAPIDVRASADAPGAVFVHARTSGKSFQISSILDDRGAVLDAGRARFDGVLPGSHRLRVRSFGYGERDTLITLPPDSSLILDVALTPGGGMHGCSSYIEEKK